MKEQINIPNWAWHLYQAKQAEARNCPNNATEETLNYLVRIFCAGDVPDTQAKLQQMIDNHLAGERQKIRRRLKIMENVAATSISTDDISQQRAPLMESLTIIQNSVTQSQWLLLTDLASGNSYQQLSSGRNCPVGTLKSSICRLRKRLHGLVFEDESISFAT